ncbi:hypothetical protein KC19_4G269500 [Ceratodon purpureus]|uniref:Uncharacterized protein n=1 Tax=Ceratodon purpureus TaxID=3225 RepID=A0A8T0IFJ6_CERPU|nr:hypothetical protein KC19_4G269500 [Ceratodon purpureus]
MSPPSHPQELHPDTLSLSHDARKLLLVLHWPATARDCCLVQIFQHVTFSIDHSEASVSPSLFWCHAGRHGEVTEHFEAVTDLIRLHLETVCGEDGSKVSAGRQDGTRPTGDEGVVSRFSFPGCDVLYGVAHKRGNRGGT